LGVILNDSPRACHDSEYGHQSHVESSGKKNITDFGSAIVKKTSKTGKKNNPTEMLDY
jgi:hypothetical protein